MNSCTLSSMGGPSAKDMKGSGPRTSIVRPKTPVLAWSSNLQGSSSNASSGSLLRGESHGRGTTGQSKENTQPNTGVTNRITRIHIRKKEQSSKSAGSVLTSRKQGNSGESEQSSVGSNKRYARIHVISDEERASNIEADKLSADIRLPRAWQASWSLQKAQRQNRTHQKQLSVRLEGIDKGLLVQFNKITNTERRVLNEFLSKYPEMYNHVMGGIRDKAVVRRLGIFPPPTSHDGSVPVLTPAQVREAEGAVIRAHLKAPGGGEFPPLNKKRVHIIAPSHSPTRRNRHKNRNNSPQVAIQLKGIKYDERDVGPDDKEKDIPKLPGTPGKSGGFITTPGVVAISSKHQNQHQQSVNVSYFVDTDFGFQPDRQRQAITGMSLQKDIQDKTQLEKDIEKVAQKHINAMTTSGLNHRASRKMEGVETLRSTIYGGQRQGFVQERSGSSRGTPISREDINSTPTKIIISPRGRRKLKSGGPLPPLEKDITKVVVVGKADGPLVADANKSIAANDNASFYDW